MSEEDIARIAAALAIANGHSDAEAYSAKVVEAWKASAPKRRESDTAAAIAAVRAEREGEQK